MQGKVYLVRSCKILGLSMFANAYSLLMVIMGVICVYAFIIIHAEGIDTTESF